jgi:predicted DNA-binding protein (UPF0278 family)
MAINIDQDTSKADEGVWTTYSGSKFKVANIGAAKFQRTLNRLQMPYRRKIEKGTMDPVDSRQILCQAMAEGLIVAWDDVVDKKGEKVEFSHKLCEKMLINNPDLREYIQEYSLNLDNFKNEEQEELGNGLSST